MPRRTNGGLSSGAIGLADLPLRLGYVPLTDAAPLLVAEARGLFARYGVRVVLSAEPSWATLRDKLAFGALDGAHLLGPMAIAAAVGAGGLTRRLAIGCGLARNGNALVLSHALAAASGAGDDPLPAEAFAQAVRRWPEPPRLAVVFAHSSHNYLLRHWLASGGLDPDADVRLVVVPPPRCAEALAAGAIDGFCSGEPWGSHAVATGAGRLVLTTGDILPDHPEKVLAFAEGAPRAAAIAATAAVIEAAAWLDAPGNRGVATALLARAFPGVAIATVALALDGTARRTASAPPVKLAHPLRFGGAGEARPDEAAWFLAAMRRWEHLPPFATDDAALAPWCADLFTAALAHAPIQEPAA